MDRTVHIVSNHYENPFWIDIQLESIKKYVKIPYKTYMVHAYMPEDIKEYKNHFDVLIKTPEKSIRNWDGHKLILPYVKENLNPNDIVIKLDSDAIFISDVDESMFNRVDSELFIALKEPLHELDTNLHTAHPVFYAFKGEYLDDGLDKALSICSISNSNWWGGVDKWLNKRNIDWGVIERSNVTELHSFYFAIYGDLIYHHWAGSELMKSGQKGFLRREDRRRAKREGISLKEVVEKNHKLNKSVLKEIQSDFDGFIKKLKTKEV